MIKEVWSVAPNTAVYEALQEMAKKDIGAVLVVERDELARHILRKGLRP